MAPHTRSDVLVAHQPAYLPWPGYFTRLMSGADRLVLLDHVQFSERGFQNRNTVADRRGTPTLLTVPVRRHHGQALADTRIAGTEWAPRHWRTLTQNYGKAPFWPAWSDRLAEVYDAPGDRLTDLNERLIRLLLDGLGLHVDIVRSSTLELTGAKTQMLVELAHATGCRTLRVGTGALDYLDAAELRDAGIRVEVATYRPSDVLAGRGTASVLDTLLRHGPATGDLVAAGAEITAWQIPAVAA